MRIKKLLIANRGEIAVRIHRSATLMAIQTVGVYSESDQQSRHWQITDEAVPLAGKGAQPYLDHQALIQAAKKSGCDALHPGYGFLSESAEFAAAVTQAGITFIGPEAAHLQQLGDKTQARLLAEQLGIPVQPAMRGDLQAAKRFLKKMGRPILIKANAGGGGRGMRYAEDVRQLDESWPLCQLEAAKAFGNNNLYVETWLANARHIEVQILGDASGETNHLYDRDCTLQRRFQKIIEIAPAPRLGDSLRAQLADAACRLAQSLKICGLATFEFLVDPREEAFFFMEANPRLQVEHTVTEAVTGVDLVETQIRLAEGGLLSELGLDAKQRPAPRGWAIQMRINAETVQEAQITPSSGTLQRFEPATGPGIRVDSHAYTGYTLPSAFDALLAKLIVHSKSDDLEQAYRLAASALNDFHIEGPETSLPLLRAIIANPEVRAGKADNVWIESHLPELIETMAAAPEAADTTDAGLRSDNPLAILDYGKINTTQAEAPPSDDALCSPVNGTITSIQVHLGETIAAKQALIVVEAMKMEHLINAPTAGVIQALYVAQGEAVTVGQSLLQMEALAGDDGDTTEEEAVDLQAIRPDLEEVIERHALGLDERRPGSVKKRRKTGHRTARENIADLCDEDSFIEYGPLMIAAQRRRRSLDDLMVNTPADGMLAGLGRINSALFPDEHSARCMVLSYDYTVLAGTQGHQNHRKKDRMFELAKKFRCPVVFFTEGGGGRPGDTDGIGVAGLDCLAFVWFAKLSGLVPLVGITTGRCFAGNAALLGCCDVVIATQDANIGMGGPAMIEGGGLGVFRPEEIGPLAVQSQNGVVDLVAVDEAEAVALAKQYLSYFQGALGDWDCADQRLLRTLIPENRLRVYDVRTVIEKLADTDSTLELRRDFGTGMITVLARCEGKPLGIIANNPMHQAGAIDSAAADKAARFMQLCDAHNLPLLSLCDCPGIMVGPEAEAEALVRHAGRLFVTGANLTVPLMTIILRKAYGLGAQAMAAGSFKSPYFTISWPTGEFGGMGLEGAVKLGYRHELEAIEDPDQRLQTYNKMVARMYERGKAVNMASVFEIDDTIDPAESRRWIMGVLNTLPERSERGSDKRRPYIDAW